MLDFANLMARSQREGWHVVALDLDVDTTTPASELVVNVMMVLAQWERRIISDRTKEALAQARANGTQLGRPSTLPAATRRKVLRMHRKGMNYSAIARQLTADQVPTAQGGQWRANTVRKVVQHGR